MEERILKGLYEPFDVKTKPGAGNYKYIKSSDAVDRMNRTFEGNWSTEVVSDTIIEDTIVVRILVTVYPFIEEGKQSYPSSFSHEGYGSSPIKRYNSGPNKDKIINIGSDYKAASSMAIRNACSRWGVGIHLDEEGAGKFVAPTRAQVKAVAAEPVTMQPVPPKAEVRLPSTPVKLPSSPPKASAPQAPPLPESSSTPPAVKEPVSKAPSLPFPTANEVVDKAPPRKATEAFPKIPMPSAPVQIPSSESGESDTISEVQKAALNGLLTIRGLDYNKLVTDAFTEKKMEIGSTIPASDDLTYKQAVVVIKYGNDLFKKKN